MTDDKRDPSDDAIKERTAKLEAEWRAVSGVPSMFDAPRKRDLSAVYDPNHSDVVAARERDGWTRLPPNSVGMRSNGAGLWEFYRADSNGDVTYRLPMTEEQMREARAGRPVDVPAELRRTADAPRREIAGGRPIYTNAIAKAPEHVAALLAEVQRLRAENAKLREALEGVSDTMESWWTGGVPGRGAFYATCDVADGGPMLLAVREALKR